jgi:hypothetical protein
MLLQPSSRGRVCRPSHPSQKPAPVPVFMLLSPPSLCCSSPRPEGDSAGPLPQHQPYRSSPRPEGGSTAPPFGITPYVAPALVPRAAPRAPFPNTNLTAPALVPRAAPQAPLRHHPPFLPKTRSSPRPEGGYVGAPLRAPACIPQPTTRRGAIPYSPGDATTAIAGQGQAAPLFEQAASLHLPSPRSRSDRHGTFPAEPKDRGTPPPETRCCCSSYRDCSYCAQPRGRSPDCCSTTRRARSSAYPCETAPPIISARKSPSLSSHPGDCQSR